MTKAVVASAQPTNNSEALSRIPMRKTVLTEAQSNGSIAVDLPPVKSQNLVEHVLDAKHLFWYTSRHQNKCFD
jgi:hypothetical protein